jgi:hypothetical protein
MRRWISRSLWAAALGLALPAAVAAQQPMPPATPPADVPPPAANVGPTPAPPPVPVPAPPVAPVVILDPYRAASPYNAIVVGRPVPNPQYNRPNFTLPCDNPNQNFAPLQLEPREWPVAGHFFRHSGKGGCDDGCNGGRLKGKHHGGCGDAGGSCATCNTSSQFIWGSSRTFFGESSREFFERPPSVDGLPHPHTAAKRATPTTIVP